LEAKKKWVIVRYVLERHPDGTIMREQISRFDFPKGYTDEDLAKHIEDMAKRIEKPIEIIEEPSKPLKGKKYDREKKEFI